MELSGDEKRIQALFSELRLSDDRLAPPFNIVLNRAKSAPVRSPRGFSFSFAAGITVICAIALIAWWSKTSVRQETPPVVTVTAVGNENAAVVPKVGNSTATATQAVRHLAGVKSASVNRSRLLAKRLAARRRAEMLAANQKVLQDALAISKWESPTATLLSSSTDEVLTSLPQLNQNANQLRSFLPTRSN